MTTKNVHETTARATALVPVTVDGWPLARGEHGDHWIRDLDLAERAELTDPRTIRRTIGRLVKEDVLTIWSGNPNGPLVRTTTEIVDIGSGAQREVTVYYLNREAAVLVAMRLRTPKAVELQIAVVQVFLHAIDGTLPPAASALAAPTTPAPMIAANDVAALGKSLVLAVREAFSPMIELMASSLHGRFDAIELRLIEMGRRNGLLGAEQVEHVKNEVTALAETWVRIGWAKSLKSAGTQILKDVYGLIDWGNGERRVHLIPAADYQRVTSRIARLKWEATDYVRRNAKKAA